MPTITVRTLACGMPLVIEQMPGVRSFALSWLLPAGSATEPDDRQGLGAMWAELVFRGVGDLDSRAQADALDRLGLTRSCEVTTPHIRFSYTGLGSRLADSLPLIVDMALRPRFEDEAIEPARDLAVQAIESLADDPQERAVICVKERHNAVPLNRSGMGTIAGLEALTREDLVEGWRRQARPIGSIMAIAGDIAAAGGADAIASRLDVLLAGWAGAAPAVTPRPSTTRGTYHHEPDKSSQVQIILVHDAPAEREDTSRLERIVATVLSGGMAARLFTEVREKRGLCYSVSASYTADRDFGRCLAYVGTAPERAQESLDVLTAELHRINTEAGSVTKDEFARAMTGMKAGIVMSGESTGARAGSLAIDQYRIGRPRSLEEIAARYASVTLDEVNSYLSIRALGPTTIVTLGPTPLKPPVVTEPRH